MWALDLLRIMLLSGTMIYSSYRDWVSREVEDEVWIVSGVAGGVLTLLDLIAHPSRTIFFLTLISMVIGCGLAYAFYYFGFYGGADAKAVMVISIGLPIFYPIKRLHPFTGLASLSNGLIISLIIPVSMFFMNLLSIIRGEKIFEGFEHEGKFRKLAAIFLGIRVKDARRRKFWLPIEEEKNGRRVFNFNLLTFELERPRRDDCWITPGIPLLIFIACGFLLFVTIGDILSLIVSLAIR